METNKSEEAREVANAWFPSQWVWMKKETKWSKRKKTRLVGRIYYAPPASGDK